MLEAAIEVDAADDEDECPVSEITHGTSPSAEIRRPVATSALPLSLRLRRVGLEGEPGGALSLIGHQLRREE